MDFWSVFVSECSKIGKKPNPVAKELGISSGSVTQWKNGGTPRPDILLRIAAYFGKTVSYMLGESEIKTPGTSEGDEQRDSFAMDYSRLTHEQRKILHAVMREMLPKD